MSTLADNNNKEAPTCTALVMCYGTAEDVKSRGKTIINTFSTVGVTKLSTLHKCAVFVSLLGVRVPITLQLVIADPDGVTVASATISTTEGGDPILGYVDAGVDFAPGILLHKAGIYTTTLSTAETILSSTKFNVVVVTSNDPFGDIARQTKPLPG